MKSKNYINVLLSLFLLGAAHASRAEDSMRTQAKDKASDVKRSYKKGMRKAKKMDRDARGENSPAKDAKDKVDDAGDDLQNTYEKLENRIQK